MTERHLHLSIVPWDDPGFRTVTEDACREVVGSHPDVPPILAADLAQAAIRAAGFAGATVVCRRTFDDVRRSTMRWTAFRDGEAVPASADGPAVHVDGTPAGARTER